MVKKISLIIGLSILLFSNPIFAQDETSSPNAASFESVCSKVNSDDSTYGKFPKCADSPNDCGSNNKGLTPLNCLFLEEPIGGDPGYDLFKVSCSETVNGSPICTTTLWHGEAIIGEERGPIQAILTFEPGKDYQGPFGLLYNYISLVYNFMTGIIISFVILISIIGGIRMTISAGNTDQFSKGKDMIIKAFIGMALWFLASLILYTINPTFFTF